MARFQVPQFIEREAKVVGFLTLRQFAYLGIPAGVTFFLWFFIPNRIIFALIAIALEAIGVALAFIKIAGKPIPVLIWHFLHFSASSKTYIWRKGKYAGGINMNETEYGEDSAPEEKQDGESAVQMVKGSKLHGLSIEVATKQEL